MASVPPSASSDSPRREVVRVKHRSWMMTLWSHEDVVRLKGLQPALCVVGEEVCPQTGRLHFHAYVRFKHPRSASPLYVLFPNVDIKPLRTTEAQALKYVAKEGKVVLHLVDGVEVTDGRAVVSQEPLTKLYKKGEVEVEVHRRLREGETIRSVWEDHPIYCARNARMLRSVVRIYELWGHRSDSAEVENLSGVEL